MDEVVAAVDLGATNLRTALVDAAGEVYGFLRCDVSRLTRGVEISEKMVSMLHSSCDEYGVTPAAVGVSTAGPVDLVNGSVLESPNMHCDSVFITGPLKDTFGVPVVMATDCKAGAVGEYVFGRGANAKTLVYLTISTGIGAGVVSDGVILSGSNGNAGEVGHFVVDTTYPLTCGCGGTGHWEAYASGSGIPKFFRRWLAHRGLEQSDPPHLTAGQILHAASDGNPLFCEFAEELKKINTRGLSSVICAYNPDLIILDGPVMQEYAGLLIGKTDAYLPTPRIEVSGLSGMAPLLGAAVLAFRLAGRSL